MADEYIKRSEIHDLVNNDTSFGLYKEDDSGCDVAFSISEVHRMIDKIPSADVQPVVHGEWLPSTCEYSNYNYDCSVCGCNEYRQIGRNGKHKRFNFCPNCGARMDGGT